MPDISKRLERAEKYVQKNKLDAAIEEYLAAWKEDPDNKSVVEMVAELYVQTNDPQKALECYNYLFDKYVEQNDGAKAALVFRKMTKAGAQDPVRLLTVARFQVKQKPEEAQESYRLAAKMLLERGDKPNALEALRGLAGLDNLNAEVHLRLGEVAESLGQKELAAQSFVRAGQLRRTSPWGDGSGPSAMDLLERAHTLQPNNGQVAMVLAGAVFESGNPARAVQLLEPFAAESVPERNRLLADALLATGNLQRAEELLWAIASNYPDAFPPLLRTAEGYLRRKDFEPATNVLRKLKKAMTAAGKEREFLSAVEELQKKNLAGLELLEFLASMYDELNFDSQLGGTLTRLFDLYVEAGTFEKAANALDRIVDVDPYNSENSRRLERLGGKVDSSRYEAIAMRFQHTASAALPAAPEQPVAEQPVAEQPAAERAGEPESDVLEDLVLQAEIFLQYGLKPRAVERLQRIAKLFPGEEQRNDKLRSLYAAAQFAPKPVGSAAAAVRAEAAGAAASAEPSVEESITDITRVSDISRNIYRQGTVKGVLSTAVNEIGKTWRVNRCVAGLCTPGKPPSAALEYCALAMKQSEVMAIVKLVTTLVQTTADGNALAVEDAASSAKLGKLTDVIQASEIKSLLALPLIDADQPIGVIVLEQCDRMRRWRSNDIVVLKSVVEQMVIAISHVKLRSLMKTLAATDEQSGMLNRSSYLNCLMSECDRAQKQKTPLSVLLMQFGRGPQTARELGEDLVQKFVQEAAQSLMNHLRQNDIAVRYDSTTLALVLPDTKGKDAFFVVDKMRKLVGTIKLEGRDGLPLTAGIAEAVLDGNIDPADSVTELINRLEAALEAAQQEGGATSKLLKPPVGAAAA